MKLPIKSFALLVASSVFCLTLVGCGNKGPLVKPSNIPATTPAATPVAAPAVTEPATDPNATPAPEPASGTPAARR